jgi:hypothetical protein
MRLGRIPHLGIVGTSAALHETTVFIVAVTQRAVRLVHHVPVAKPKFGSLQWDDGVTARVHRVRCPVVRIDESNVSEVSYPYY